MVFTSDIDIDFADRTKALESLHHVPAMTITNSNNRQQRHPSGVYFQNVPVDPLNDLCAFDAQDAEQLGYIKIDFLNLSLYQGVRDEDHLIKLLDTEPDWELFNSEWIVSQLVQISQHFGVVKSIRPKSIEDLAVILALIRPGKRHLIGQPRSVIDADVWKLTGTGYEFKRAHAIAYAATIIVQLNLMCEQQAAEIQANENAGHL